MKKIAWISIALALMFAFAGCGSPAQDSPPSAAQSQQSSARLSIEPPTKPTVDVIVFNDRVLEERVRAQMNKPTGDITIAEAETVKRLDLENKDNKPEDAIKDISVLASFKNLKELIISKNAIKDISPLAKMNLEVFYSMNGNQDITDLSPLAGSTTMLDLTILGNKYINDSNIKFIDGMKDMVMLWIQDAPELSDIHAVSSFPKLWRLILNNCNVSDVSPIAGLKNLKWLQLEGNPIKDYSPLKDIYPNLEQKDFKLN